MVTVDCLMNSKSEFHQAPLVRVVPVVGLQEEQGEGELSRVGWTRRRVGRRGKGRNHGI